MAIPIQVTFDCADPERVASFWAEALGYKLQDPPEGYASWPDFLTAIGVPEAEWNRASAIVDPEGRGPRIYFRRAGCQARLGGQSTSATPWHGSTTRSQRMGMPASRTGFLAGCAPSAVASCTGSDGSNSF